MTDQEKREKVIKGLGNCIEYFASKVEGAMFDEWLEESRKAIALLKAQEAVRPVPGMWDRDIPLFNCGACGGEIGAGGIAKYCFHCGRAVKWE